MAKFPTTPEQDAIFATLPYDASTYTREQRKAVVDYFISMPMSEVRGYQDAIKAQITDAYERATNGATEQIRSKGETDIISAQAKDAQLYDAAYTKVMTGSK